MDIEGIVRKEIFLSGESVCARKIWTKWKVFGYIILIGITFLFLRTIIRMYENESTVLLIFALMVFGMITVSMLWAYHNWGVLGWKAFGYSIITMFAFSATATVIRVFDLIEPQKLVLIIINIWAWGWSWALGLSEIIWRDFGSGHPLENISITTSFLSVYLLILGIVTAYLLEDIINVVSGVLVFFVAPLLAGLFGGLGVLFLLACLAMAYEKLEIWKLYDEWRKEELERKKQYERERIIKENYS